jgi:hypothetical protein
MWSDLEMKACFESVYHLSPIAPARCSCCALGESVTYFGSYNDDGDALESNRMATKVAQPRTSLAIMDFSKDLFINVYGKKPISNLSLGSN